MTAWALEYSVSGWAALSLALSSLAWRPICLLSSPFCVPTQINHLFTFQQRSSQSSFLNKIVCSLCSPSHALHSSVEDPPTLPISFWGMCREKEEREAPSRAEIHSVCAQAALDTTQMHPPQAWEGTTSPIPCYKCCRKASHKKS